ncbi:MAG TPA: ABC transporter permease [Methanocorpusculum sp.]|nr:ABC transporter permease [Methanocorpusculum sp.]
MTDGISLVFDPIVCVAIFGAAVMSFLWLRDARIFARTALPGYRKAAYQGVIYTAIAWFGCALCTPLLTNQAFMFIGIGAVLLALYLHSRVKKEDVWTGSETALQRFLGSAPRRKP